ncbi:armadillo-type protein [Paraphysoderma sedebokerense]|nr:armadillo-type protein [Paraphysoderma sedebokerense]
MISIPSSSSIPVILRSYPPSPSQSLPPRCHPRPASLFTFLQQRMSLNPPAENEQLKETLARLQSENERLKAKIAKLETLSIEKVKSDLFTLQCLAGKDSKHALRSIDWDTDYTFANGWRSPPWRHQFGELGYLVVKIFDGDKLFITASQKGYFKNKGYKVDGKGGDAINYEQVGELYPSLVELIRAHSKHFADVVDKPFGERSVEEDEPLSPISPGGDATQRSEKDREDNNHDSEAEDKTTSTRHENRKFESPTKRTANTVKTKVEPSFKWKQITPEDVSGPTDKNKRKNINKEQQTKSHSRPDGGRRSRSHRTTDDEDESDTQSELSSEEDTQDKRQESSDPIPEQWQIQKLVKYLKAGNQTATIIAICSVRDFDLLIESNQLAIRNVGGLEILINLLDTDDSRCKIGSLKILNDISQNAQIRHSIAELGGMQPLVELLGDSRDEIKCLAAETIAHCAKNAANRRSVRKYGGIKKLVRLLKSDRERVAISGASALCSCSKSGRNKEAIRAAGSIPLLAELLKSQNEKMLIPVVGILQECASDEQYRIAIRSSGMIKFLVENLSSKSEELQTHCASAIFKCAEDDEARKFVRQYEGLMPLVSLLEISGNKDLLVAATGAVWKCAQNLENVNAFNKLNTVKKLVGLMENQPEEVLVNVVGALGACACTLDGRQAIRESNGITPLVNLLRGTNQGLLVNVTAAIGACALDRDSMGVIDRLDGVRLLWSLLKSPNPQVQASAAWAICPCIEHAKDAGEMVRSFVGGLELIVSLLKSDNVEVLASVCAALANISKDEENLAVITDHGVVPMLAKLTTTKHDRLRKHLAEAIARCCRWGNNKIAFGTAGAVAPLVNYLRSPDLGVHRATAQALHQLSMDADNCVTMHEHGVVQLLLGMVSSPDSGLQEAAAGTIGNIRRLALACEKARLS